MKQIIKLTQHHYIIVNDGEIKVGDFVYDGTKLLSQFTNRVAVILANNQFAEYGKKSFFKITHSTHPIEKNNEAYSSFEFVYKEIEKIDKSEIKELLGEVDVIDKCEKILTSHPDFKAEQMSYYQNGRFNGLIDGYNEALKDNEDKLYTNKNVIDFLHFLTFDHNHKYTTTKDAWDDFKKSLYPKTSWEIDIIDDKIVLL
jgi:hypothetical protein